jgi:hypothetical protein
MGHQIQHQIQPPTPRLTLHQIPLLTLQRILPLILLLTQLQILQILHAETVSYKAVSYAMTVIL